jgi:hypothetical protein
MNIKQISVFLENKSGRVAEVMGIIAKEKIDVKALSLSDTADFGVLRFIVDDPDRCVKILKTYDLVAQVTDVIGIEIEDKPGGLYKVLDILGKNGINVEYMYATVERKKDNAIVIFKIDDMNKAIEVLGKNGISVAQKNDVIKNLSNT